ncbi:MAG: hypothetical protein ABFC34_08095 [Methanobacterium sp.]
MEITNKTVQLGIVVALGAVAIIAVPYGQTELAIGAMGCLGGALAVREKTAQTTTDTNEDTQDIPAADLASVVAPIADTTTTQGTPIANQVDTASNNVTITVNPDELAKTIVTAITQPASISVDTAANTEAVNVDSTPQA